MKEYVIYIGYGVYACKGSMQYDFERYKNAGELDKAMRFKKKETAERRLEKMRTQFVNVDEESCVIEIPKTEPLKEN